MHTKSTPRILVYTPERTSCKRLLTLGAAVAKEEHSPLSLLFIQPQELVSQAVAEDIQIVYNIASREKAEITILFSDEPLLSLAVHARQIQATQIVTEESAAARPHTVSVLRRLLPDLPVTVLEKDGKVITFPPFEITTQNRRPHPTLVP